MTPSVGPGYKRESQVVSATDKSLASIDIARGLAALSFFVYHYGIGNALAVRTGVSWLELIALPGAVYGVPLFFVISGYCIHLSEWRRVRQSSSLETNVAVYYRRRFRRIWPAYLLALVFSLAIGFASGKMFDVKDVVLHLFFLHGFSAAYFNSINVVLWTISVEMCFYIIYPAFLYMRMRSGLGVAVAVGFAASAVALGASAALAYPYTLPVTWLFLSTWCGWIVGAALSEFPVERFRSGWSAWMWWSAGIVAWASFWMAEATALFVDRMSILQVPARICISAWLLMLFLVLEERWSMLPRPLAWIASAVGWCGACSYSLYLLHEPLISARNLFQGSVPRELLMFFQVTWFFVILWISRVVYEMVELRFMRPASARIPP